MKLSIKLTAAIILIVGLIYWANYEPETATSKHSTPKSSDISAPLATPHLFEVDSINKIRWDYGGIGTTLTKKSDGHWQDSNQVDDWGVRRRLTLLSEINSNLQVKIEKPLGEIEIYSKNQNFKFIYDINTIAISKDGIFFGAAMSPGLRTLIGEGLWGFKSHALEFCNFGQTSKIDFLPTPEKIFQLSKVKDRWTIQDGVAKPVPARSARVQEWLEKICHIQIDTFSLDGFHSEVVERKILPQISVTDSSRPANHLFKKNEFYILQLAKNEKSIPMFTSNKLDQLFNITYEELKDPSLDEAKVATDKSKKVNERVDAIRRLKLMRSPEAVATLKEIIFENTDIDVFRYEAVDALAGYGTGEAYEIIANRLEKEGRSGFQLRMARALAGAMGVVFLSDEKTSDEVRQPEVKSLLTKFRAHPPGK